ncbi:hypothetical protein MML48_1g02415 [Holotrichia oblita]|uniref:Uncharacterized protein n=1 Tax=Holotrichia oblita TaxID=644536 RepID=A0ACB9TSL6_HOLOL|nr:hypothetical protein MML48_1g02415 [Holotrichia oblita]
MEDAALFGTCAVIVSILDSNSSSSDDEDEYRHAILRNKLKKRLREDNCSSDRILNFLELTVPDFTTKQFQSHFQISRAMFERLAEVVGPKLNSTAIRGRKTIHPEKQLLAVIWLLATSESYRSVGNRFNMGKASLFWCFLRVIDALSDISSSIIKWPDIVERNTIIEKFKSLVGMVGVVGAINGTYVPIKAPKQNAQQYVNRKHLPAITLQVIAAPTLKFLDCFAGYPSSVSDIRVFRNSPTIVSGIC